MKIRNLIIGTLTTAASIALVLQCVIAPSATNIACSCIIFASSIAVLLYIVWTDALEVQPISTFAILGFCLTTQLGALLVQTASWIPVSASLYDPIYTFFILAFYQAVAMLVHAVYCLFNRSKPERQLLRGLFTAMGLYRTPSAPTLWVMAVIGLASYVVSSFPPPLGKVGDGFNFLCWAPFLIPIYSAQIGEGYCNKRVNSIMLGFHIGAIVFLALALNIRTILFSGAVMVGLNYLLIGLRSHATVQWRSLRKLPLYALIALILAKPLSYVTTAMAVAHAARGKVTADVMIGKTINILQHPALIAAFRKREKKDSEYSGYDEHYLENPILARFVETKFHDNTLHFAGMLTSDENQALLREATERSLWALLPDPVLKMMGLKIDKGRKGKAIGSNGDYIVYLAKGIPLGGFKTGSVFAQGIALFGILFPFVYAAILWLLYAVMDLLTVRSSNERAISTALAMMNSWRFFIWGITADGLDLIFALILRYFMQMILIYSLVQWMAKPLSFKKDDGGGRVPANRGLPTRMSSVR
jgi:hypothetical protein